MYRLKMEMEDLALKHLEPEVLRRAEQKDHRPAKRTQKDIDDFIRVINQHLGREYRGAGLRPDQELLFHL
ncbi:MAG: hypothetical protein U5N26_06050 [Candidatus Marinimicrobia bacterium]|nr:hypothetical protein [Candidatus Neomarinimicrobiota bacterium]